MSKELRGERQSKASMTKSIDTIIPIRDLFNLGYESRVNAEHAMLAMGDAGVSEDDIARALVLMAAIYANPQGTAEKRAWNPDAFVAAIRVINPNVNWECVMLMLDQPEFIINTTGLKLIVNVWECSRPGESFPAHLFFRTWQNIRGQSTALFCMASISPEVLDLSRLGGRKVVTDAEIETLHSTTKRIALRMASHQLNSLDLIEALLSLYDSTNDYTVNEDIRWMLDQLKNKEPGLLFLGMVKIKPMKNKLHPVLLDELLNRFLIGEDCSNLAFTLLWRSEPDILRKRLWYMYVKEPDYLSRILEITQEAKITEDILNVNQPIFTLDLASLAAGREHLNMEMWLTKKINSTGQVFVEACLEFLEKKMIRMLQKKDSTGAWVDSSRHDPIAISSVILSPDVFKTLFKVVAQRVTTEAQKQVLGNLYLHYVQQYPAVNATVPHERIQESVIFILDHLSENSVHNDLNKLRDILTESTWIWFGDLLVTKYISANSHKHGLFSILLDNINLPQMNEMVAESTCTRIKEEYERLKKTDHSPTAEPDIAMENAVLWNYGSWLGRITIAKNKPILHKDISFKELLLDAHQNDCLVLVMPFVCAVLEQAKNSKVFKPPNPWLMGTVKLLAEMYWLLELSQNLKSEIESLFETLGLGLKDVEPTSLLQNIIPKWQQEIIRQFLSRLQINEAIFNQPMAIKQLQYAMRDALINAALPHVDKATTIAANSTQALVRKDYIFEWDETKIKADAHLLATGVAGGMAEMLCKTPLCNEIKHQLKTYLLQDEMPQQFQKYVDENVIPEAISGNIDLLLVCVNELARQSVVEKVDKHLLPLYQSRVSHRKRITKEDDIADPNLFDWQEAKDRKAELERYFTEAFDTLQTHDENPHAWIDIERLFQRIRVMLPRNGAPLSVTVTHIEKGVCMLYQNNEISLEPLGWFLQRLVSLSHETCQQVTAWLFDTNDERKLNTGATATMLQRGLLSKEEYDTHLAKQIKAGKDAETVFAVDLVRFCLLSDTPTTCLEDHALTLSSLLEITSNSKTANNRTIELFNDLKKHIGTPLTDTYNNVDCVELRLLMAQWSRLSQHPLATKGIKQALARKIVAIIKSGPADMYFFYRLCIETYIDQCLFESDDDLSGRCSFERIDSFAKFVALLISLEESQNNEGRATMVAEVFSVIVLVLAKHHENTSNAFNQKPFYRLLASIFFEINQVCDASLEISLMAAFCDTLYTLQPLDYPGFSASWLLLLSSQPFLPMILASNKNEGWRLFQRLLLALLKFLGPLLEETDTKSPEWQFYLGTLRVLRMLNHDFPNFLSASYIQLVMAIPLSLPCLQLRNHVLYAYPERWDFSEPLTGTLSPNEEEHFSLQAVDEVLSQNSLKADVDEYAKSKEVAYVEKIWSHLEAGSVTKDDVETMSAFVVYSGSCATGGRISYGAAFDMYRYLLSKLSAHGRFLLLHMIVDQLRYPCARTTFFISVMWHLFDVSGTPVKELVTRLLMERLIVKGLKPWGVQYLFIRFLHVPDFMQLLDYLRAYDDGIDQMLEKYLPSSTPSV